MDYKAWAIGPAISRALCSIVLPFCFSKSWFMIARGKESLLRWFNLVLSTSFECNFKFGKEEKRTWEFSRMGQLRPWGNDNWWESILQIFTLFSVNSDNYMFWHGFRWVPSSLTSVNSFIYFFYTSIVNC